MLDFLATTQVKFQSTRPRGARPVRSVERGDQRYVSIHAPARGATPRTCALRASRGSFNPRARAGRDAALFEDALVNNTFQSTRPRGARLPACKYIAANEIWPEIGEMLAFLTPRLPKQAHGGRMFLTGKELSDSRTSQAIMSASGSRPLIARPQKTFG